MDVTQNMRKLEALGFREDTLYRAVALAGASRVAYAALYQAVTSMGLTPEAAIQAVESAMSNCL